ncbi:MAG TPA: hypothetical protein EYP62_00440 [Kiritimatiellae bacterium]|nr:hypothetical protein [Kiritimatiellia bacterium]
MKRQTSRLLIVLLLSAAAGSGETAGRSGNTLGAEGANLLLNPSFEKPDHTGRLPADWVVFAVDGTARMRLTSEDVLDGEKSLAVRMLPRRGMVVGILSILPVESSFRYDFSVHCKRASRRFSPGAGYIQLVVEWLDGSGKELARSQSRRLPLAHLSRRRWKKLEIRRLRPPRGARNANFGVQFWPEGARGEVYVDRAVVLVR